MNIRLLVIVCFLIYPLKINAQSTTGKQKAIVDRTIAYLKRLSLVSVEWTNDPKKKEYRKEMEDLVKSYDVIKEEITSVLIIVGSESDKNTLIELLNSKSDRDRLIEQLLLWKYEVKPILGIDIVSQLDELYEASTGILLNLQDEKTSDDAISVLLSQNAAESIIAPLSKDVIEKLTNLKSTIR